MIAVFLAFPAVGHTQLKSRAPSHAEIQNPKQTEAEGTHQPTEPDKSTPKITPSIVKQIPTKETKPKSFEHSGEGGDQSSADWWMVKLTAILAAIGFLQLIVFGRQAVRLRQTIDTMKELGEKQSADMQASIAVAKLSADAATDSNKLTRDLFYAEQRP